MEILKVDEICKKYPEFELKNVSFKVESGQIMGFVGRNGAGKSSIRTVQILPELRQTLLSSACR